MEVSARWERESDKCQPHEKLWEHECLSVIPQCTTMQASSSVLSFLEMPADFERGPDEAARLGSNRRRRHSIPGSYAMSSPILSAPCFWTTRYLWSTRD